MGSAMLLARVLVAELVASGVREVVLAPGSRSAPLALVLAEADRAGRLRLHVRIDERTAGFLALGLAKAEGDPVAVLTTSGTAAANLHPAVLEAWHAHLPLVLITADRPRTMINTGANQTTHQAQLFTGHLRAFAGLSDAVSDLRGWRFETTRLLSTALGTRTRLPGPVHLNVELSDPLIEAAAPPAARSVPSIAPAGGGSAALLLPEGPRTVVVAGDASATVGQAAAALAEAAALPLFAEPSSNARRGPAAVSTYRLLLASDLADQIERVVVFGHPTLSRPVLRLLSRDDVELIVVSPYADWVDPGQAASVVTDAVTFAARSAPRTRRTWLAAWQRAEAELSSELTELLTRQPVFTGPALARTLWTGLSERDVLLIGASNPIRDVDLAPISAGPPQVFASRGLSGIDGSISTAAGIALALGRPTHALLGDVTAVHDLTGLAIGPGEPRPDLRIVVANDDGGSIFATLEQGGSDHSDAFERVFATPHGVRFEALAEAVGVGYRRVRDSGELAAVLARPPAGVEMVEAIIDRVDRRRLDQAITGLVTGLATTSGADSWR